MNLFKICFSANIYFPEKNVFIVYFNLKKGFIAFLITSGLKNGKSKRKSNVFRPYLFKLVYQNFQKIKAQNFRIERKMF